MIAVPVAESSETTLMSTIHKLSDAGGSVIQVRTREPLRAATVLRKHFIGGDAPYREWDVVNGFRVFTRENLTENRIGGDSKDFLEALATPLGDLRNPVSEINARADRIHYFVYVNPHPYIAGNPIAAELLQQYAAILPSTNICTLFVTPDIKMPEVAAGTVLVAELTTPTAQELGGSLERIVRDATRDKASFPRGGELTAEDVARIAAMGLGLSLFEFETHVSLAIIDAVDAGEASLTKDRLMRGVAKGKTEVVRQSEILELTHPADIKNVGGMGRLKDWITARSTCYSEDAKAFGIEPPRGMVLCGLPGGGKSLISRAVASILEVPLVRLDFGRVFSKYVGDSESRVRDALKMVEGMAPVVLMIDEIDKGLGGAGGGGDSGTSSRVLGSFLTWLQDCKESVFTVVTANRVDGLPPELLRRGRFDQVWSVGMPEANERREVLAIHLRLRQRSIKDFSDADVALFLAASEGYVPAEIESAVKDALVMAFNEAEGNGLEMRHLLSALRDMVPMSRSNKEQIDRMVAWARDNATPVSYPAPATRIGTPLSSTRILRSTRRPS